MVHSQSRKWIKRLHTQCAYWRICSLLFSSLWTPIIPSFVMPQPSVVIQYTAAVSQRLTASRCSYKRNIIKHVHLLVWSHDIIKKKNICMLRKAIDVTSLKAVWHDINLTDLSLIQSLLIQYKHWGSDKCCTFEENQREIKEYKKQDTPSKPTQRRHTKKCTHMGLWSWLYLTNTEHLINVSMESSVCRCLHVICGIVSSALY